GKPAEHSDLQYSKPGLHHLWQTVAMTTRFPARVSAALERLEQTSARLSSLDPQDPDSIERALAERRRAISELAGALEGVDGCEELVRRLETALAAGRETMIRVTLVREQTRSQLVYVNQELHWLRDLQPLGKGGKLDFSG